MKSIFRMIRRKSTRKNYFQKTERRSYSKEELTQAEKRRRRLLREPVQTMNELEEDVWTPVIQVGGSIIVALQLRKLSYKVTARL